MSTTLTGYAVDFDRLKSIYGGNNERLLEKILVQRRRDLREMNEGVLADGIRDGRLTVQQALGDIIAGRITDRKSGAQYHYALEQICQTVGTWFAPSVLSGIAGSWMFETFGPVLEKKWKLKGVLTLQELMEKGPPIPLPEPEDFPAVGSFTPEEVDAALDKLWQVDRTGVDPEVLEGVAEIEAWLKTAKKAGVGLITYYY